VKRERETDHEAWGKPDGCQDSEGTRAGYLVLAPRRRGPIIAVAVISSPPCYYSIAFILGEAVAGKRTALVMRTRQTSSEVFVIARDWSALVARAWGKGTLGETTAEGNTCQSSCKRKKEREDNHGSLVKRRVTRGSQGKSEMDRSSVCWSQGARGAILPYI